MAALNDEYDKNAEASGVMPEHECTAQVTNSDYKTTAKGDGKYIALTWTILDGPYTGRTLFANYNIKNPNKMAQDIGNAEFAAVRIALFGSKEKVVSDTMELHSIPCRLKIGCKKRKDTGEMENHIKKVTSLREAVGASSTPGTQKPF